MKVQRGKKHCILVKGKKDYTCRRKLFTKHRLGSVSNLVKYGSFSGYILKYILRFCQDYIRISINCS